MVTKKFIAILVLIVLLGGIITFEQVYMDQTVGAMMTEIEALDKNLEDGDLAASKARAHKIINMWEQKEMIICLFVDYRDIEPIGRQSDLVLSHLENEDFELAKVECNTLRHVVLTFGNTVSIDWHNIP